jgi:hypothetical protein
MGIALQFAGVAYQENSLVDGIWLGKAGQVGQQND